MLPNPLMRLILGAQVAELAPIACASNMTCEVVPSSLKSTTETFPSDEVHIKQPLVHEGAHDTELTLT